MTRTARATGYFFANLAGLALAGHNLYHGRNSRRVGLENYRGQANNPSPPGAGDLSRPRSTRQRKRPPSASVSAEGTSTLPSPSTTRKATGTPARPVPALLITRTRGGYREVRADPGRPDRLPHAAAERQARAVRVADSHANRPDSNNAGPIRLASPLCRLPLFILVTSLHHPWLMAGPVWPTRFSMACATYTILTLPFGVSSNLHLLPGCQTQAKEP